MHDPKCSGATARTGMPCVRKKQMEGLPAQPSASHTLMMNRIRDEDAGLGSGYWPSLLYPFRLGRSCKMENKRLRTALARVSVPNRTGWKPTTNSVAASRFGQQNVSSRGEAMAHRRRREERTGGRGGLRCQKRRDKREETVGYMTRE